MSSALGTLRDLCGLGSFDTPTLNEAKYERILRSSLGYQLNKETNREIQSRETLELLLDEEQP
jgi:hypothetical protein